MNEDNCTNRPDPRPTDHKSAVPADVAARSSESAELSVISGRCFEGEN